MPKTVEPMRVGALVLGPLPLIATLILPPPAGLSADAWAAAGLGMMMAIWWLTEAVPLAVTALLPLAVWPILSGAGTAELSGSYAHPLIFLFLGGFFLAAAIERSGLHRRMNAIKGGHHHNHVGGSIHGRPPGGGGPGPAHSHGKGKKLHFITRKFSLFA